MHTIYQLLFALWILTSFGENIPSHASINPKYYAMESYKGHNRTFARQSAGERSKSGGINSTKRLESPFEESPNIHSGNHQGVATSYKKHTNAYSAQGRALVAKLKRAAVSSSGNNINPRRHEKQKKSNHVMPRGKKLHFSNSESLKRKKGKKQQKHFDIKLPFPNLESKEKLSDEYNRTVNATNETNNLSKERNGAVMSDNGDTGQYAISIDGTDAANNRDLPQRKTKRHRLNRKVRVPLPFNSPSDHSKMENRETTPMVSFKRHRRQKKKRLPPLH